MGLLHEERDPSMTRAIYPGKVDARPGADSAAESENRNFAGRREQEERVPMGTGADRDLSLQGGRGMKLRG